MEQHYPIRLLEGEIYQYWFVSIGKNEIIKCVCFTPLGSKNSHINLGLLDYLPEKQQMNDQVITNNGDSRTVLMTVAWCIEDYLNRFPNRCVVFSGTTRSRNLLYWRMMERYKEIWRDRYHVKLVSKNNDIDTFYVRKIIKFES